ncbi:MAG: EAL domain-containing protein [Lachnospira sp.]|uniref:EAL domain, c-di-GMP-specific phosphodiesterase class I (Or its enzymatically inactive variant) n=1 Tax=Lachnospira pectinoschiza TaxID=28052 RepID=A0A1G9YAU0_9FIRM|nr:EAL domain-containing protein [Lachnospira pectinoschiza]MCR5515577.1 EAL domain-containing protein [Lachnospira sp.]SDN06177.1 EAL domain, c-di-GMP-specific phosphodiesterase class I (or its enzymatically inactive variant) [Lachnospira pectinoschiza]
MGVDTITGLYDFNEFLNRAKAHISKYASQYAIIINDVSNFKYINKFYSKQTGDVFIDDMARYYLVGNPRSVCACRIDAEQFATVLDLGDIHIDNELKRIVWMNEEFEKVMNNKFPDIYIHVYTGIYFFSDTKVDLREAFDKAKMAKASIKGKLDIPYKVYDPNEFINKENEMEASNLFRKAHQEDRVVAFLQPQFSFKDKKVVGAELLSRIIDEEGDIVEPRYYISTLEQTGIISALDKLMTEKAFAILRRWEDEGRDLMPISVNVARQEYVKPDFVKRMKDLQRMFNVAPKYIEFEILESSFLENSDLILKTTNELREFGFQVSVDDFGSGYSSLNQIATIPADTIKLDKKFASKSLKTEKGKVVVKSLIRMLKDIDYKIVFEGIETEVQYELARDYECDLIQGYIIDKPIPVSKFEERYNKQHRQRD